MTHAVRTGVIGAGGLGHHHIRILRDLLGPDFAGFYESRTDRAAQVASGEVGTAAHSVAWRLHQHGYRWDEDGRWGRWRLRPTGQFGIRRKFPARWAGLTQ